MKQVDNDYVLKITNSGIGEYISYDKPEQNKYKRFFIALEACKLDTLFDYIVATKPFSEPLAAYLID